MSCNELRGRRNKLFHDLVDGETGRLLPRRELLKRCQELTDIGLGRHQKECPIQPPVPVRVRRDGRPLIRIRAQIEEPRNPCLYIRLTPDQHGARRPLLGEDNFPVVVAQRRQITVVRKIEEFLTGALFRLAGQIGQKVVSVQMHLEILVPALWPFFSFSLISGPRRPPARWASSRGAT